MQKVDQTVDKTTLANGQQKEPKAQPKQHSVDRFRALLEESPEEGAQFALGSLVFSGALNPSSKASGAGDGSDGGAFPAKMVPPVVSPVTLPLTALAPSALDLALQVTTGPMAGLLVQAKKQGNALQLRLGTKDQKLQKQLSENLGSIKKALANWFTIPIHLELEDDNSE